MRKKQGAIKARGRPTRDSASLLTRQRIVKAAIEIVDRQGLAALSMRRLGVVLGVDPMAIYYHVPNKATLYDAIVEAVTAEMDLSPAFADGTPLDRLRHMAQAYKNALLAHPNAISVVAARPVRTPASLRPIEKMLALIVPMGFTPQEAIAFVDVCGHFIIGWAITYMHHVQDSEMHQHDAVPLDKLPVEEFPNLHSIFAEAQTADPFAIEFEMGLDALLRGLLSARECTGT